MFISRLFKDAYQGNKKAIEFLFSVTLPILLLTSHFTHLINTPNFQKRGSIVPPIDTIRKGKFIISVSKHMDIYDKNEITLGISTDLSDSEMIKNIHRDQFFKIDSLKRITTIINAKLIDPTDENYKITKETNEKQFIDYYGQTSWSWNVQPIKTGSNNLEMVLTYYFKTKETVLFKDTIIFNEPIKILAPMRNISSHFISQHWQILLTSLFIPFVMWTFNRYNKSIKNDMSKRKIIGFKPDNRN